MIKECQVILGLAALPSGGGFGYRVLRLLPGALEECMING